jgi:hypothetical protein
MTTYGSWTQRRWSAAGRRKPSAARIWPDPLSTATVPAIPATSGGLRLHLLTTLHGLPAGFALAGAKADERQVLLEILQDDALTTGRAGQVIIGDKNYYGHEFKNTLARQGLVLLRPPAMASPTVPAGNSSSRCARSSSSSTTRSKASSTSNATAGTPHSGSWLASCSASSP